MHVKAIEAMYTYIPAHGPTKAAFLSCQDLLSRTFSLPHIISHGGQEEVTKNLTEHTVALELNQIVQSTPTDNQGDVILWHLSGDDVFSKYTYGLY